MRRRLPPFAAVRAFEAAARLGSFKAAADELCVTPSAISHQVRALEDFLDTALFDRTGTGVRPTFTGRAYQGKLSRLLDAFEASVADTGRPDLRVLCTPNFAARWLAPRIGDFAHGDAIRLQVSEGAPDTDFSRNHADVVIHWSDAPIPGAAVIPFMQSERFPVATPDFAARAGLTRPDDLRRTTLIHDVTMDAWDDWFAQNGLPGLDAPRGPRFPNCELATTAAERGQGVALAYGAMIDGTLAEGSLVRLFEAETLPIVIYSFACPLVRQDEPLIAAFRDWVLETTAAHRPRAKRPARPARPDPARGIGVTPARRAAGWGEKQWK